MTSMAASAHVLQTYELVEHTPLHLSLVDLLLVQRVCKTWHSVSKRSHRIHQALFIDPYPRFMVKLNPKSKEPDYRWDWVTDQGEIVSWLPMLNSLMVQFVCKWSEKENTLAKIRRHGLITPTDTGGGVGKVGRQICSLHYPEASWKRMLMLQPAPRDIAFFCSEKSGDAFLARDEYGLRLGGTINEIRKHWFVCPNCPTDNSNEVHWETSDTMWLDIIAADTTGWELLERLEGFTSEERPVTEKRSWELEH